MGIIPKSKLRVINIQNSIFTIPSSTFQRNLPFPAPTFYHPPQVLISANFFPKPIHPFHIPTSILLAIHLLLRLHSSIPSNPNNQYNHPNNNMHNHHSNHDIPTIPPPFFFCPMFAIFQFRLVVRRIGGIGRSGVGEWILWWGSRWVWGWVGVRKWVLRGAVRWWKREESWVLWWGIMCCPRCELV
jgi:hypothetical protein